MNMSRPHAVGGRVGRGKSPKHFGRPRSSSPVRLTNQMTVLHKGRGKKRGGKSR